MSLIRCPHCGEMISDRGAICPHCKTWLQNDAYEQFVQNKRQELYDEGERQYRSTSEYKKKAKEEQRIEQLPVCPICGKKDNVKRIGILNRALSVSVLGLASSKIGKQYECTACKHRW